MEKFSYLIIFFLSLFAANSIVAQPGETEFLNPVEWTFELGDKVGDRYDLKFKATIDEGWHLYSHFIDDDGPVPTSIVIEENEAVDVKEKLKEVGKKITKHDDAFDMELSWYENEVTFVQKAKLLKGFDGAILKGEVEFMVCDDKQCLPPEYIPFSFVLGNAVEEAISINDGGAIDINSGIGEVAFQDPAKWSYRVTEDGENLNVEYKLELEKGWQIYSQHIEEGGPLKTEFLFDGRNNTELIGNVKEEGELIKKNEPVFDNMELLSYEDQVIYTQSAKWIDTRDPILSGTIDYMVCENGACIPGGFEYKINLKENRGEWQSFNAEPIGGEDGTSPETSEVKFDWEKQQLCEGQTEENTKENKGNWIIFFLGIGGGLFALLTPCVFPMIPLTVSFFTNDKIERSKGIMNAMIYGVSIIVLYVGLSLIVTGIFGADIMNLMAASPIVNTIFFIIFVIFAFSFFGFFEISLPSSWTNQADKAANKGGLLGIVFMAFTLALVSFSCTGPIIGSLLVEAATGEGATLFGRIPIKPMIGMFGFSLALALPFTLFALFPSWLNSLPQSGGWLNVVKVFLGFLELALAFKFLSAADLAGNWGILKIEPFLIIWIIIFAATALYLFGVIRFPYDSKGAKIGYGRIFMGVISVLFVAYLAIGLINNSPRKALSGLAPPSEYSLFNPKDCPADLSTCFKEFDDGLAYAKKHNKPILIDFTGKVCVNCRKMEENIWTVEEVNNELQKFVLISLYVDDTKSLPEEETFISNASGKTKKIKTVGNKWHNFEITHFKKVSQPYYVLVSPDLEVLNKPVAYTPNSDEYLDWLKCGLNSLEEVCPDCN